MAFLCKISQKKILKFFPLVKNAWSPDQYFLVILEYFQNPGRKTGHFWEFSAWSLNWSFLGNSWSFFNFPIWPH